MDGLVSGFSCTGSYGNVCSEELRQWENMRMQNYLLISPVWGWKDYCCGSKILCVLFFV